MKALEPRLMSGTDAAAYCGVTLNTWSTWVASGRAPKPLPGTRRWDRKAIDLALDKLSGITAPTHDDDDAFATWTAAYDARNAKEARELAEWRIQNEARKAALAKK